MKRNCTQIKILIRVHLCPSAVEFNIQNCSALEPNEPNQPDSVSGRRAAQVHDGGAPAAGFGRGRFEFLDQTVTLQYGFDALL